MHHSLVKDTIIECHNVMVYSHKRTDTVRMEDGHQGHWEDGHQQEDEHLQGGWTTVVRLDTGREDRHREDRYQTDTGRTPDGWTPDGRTPDGRTLCGSGGVPDGHQTDTVWEWGCVFGCVGLRVCFVCVGVRVCFWLCGCVLTVCFDCVECTCVFGCVGVWV